MPWGASPVQRFPRSASSQNSATRSVEVSLTLERYASVVAEPLLAPRGTGSRSATVREANVAALERSDNVASRGHAFAVLTRGYPQ